MNIDKNIEKQIKDIKADMEMEGFHITQEEEENVRRILNGKEDGRNLIKKAIEEYRR